MMIRVVTANPIFILILISVLLYVVLYGRREQNNRVEHSNTERNIMLVIAILCSMSVMTIAAIIEYAEKMSSDFYWYFPSPIVLFLYSIAFVPFFVFLLVLGYGKKVQGLT